MNWCKYPPTYPWWWKSGWTACRSLPPKRPLMTNLLFMSLGKPAAAWLLPERDVVHHNTKFQMQILASLIIVFSSLRFISWALSKQYKIKQLYHLLKPFSAWISLSRPVDTGESPDCNDRFKFCWLKWSLLGFLSTNSTWSLHRCDQPGKGWLEKQLELWRVQTVWALVC